MRIGWLTILFCAAGATLLPVPRASADLAGLPGAVWAQIQWPWDQPPPEFKEMEREGFHAGVQAAINDYNHHREPDPERRKEYRKPHVQRSFVEDYRKGFRRGYDDAMRHMIQSNGRHS